MAMKDADYERFVRNLNTCHPDLKRLFIEVVKVIDCVAIDGHRDKARQNASFKAGKSKLTWPRSKHNKMPSLAVDVVPHPINWHNTRRFYYFVGLVKGIASQMGIKIRCGADWDGDHTFADQTFHDLAHFELLGADK